MERHDGKQGPGDLPGASGSPEPQANQEAVTQPLDLATAIERELLRQEQLADDAGWDGRSYLLFLLSLSQSRRIITSRTLMDIDYVYDHSDQRLAGYVHQADLRRVQAVGFMGEGQVQSGLEMPDDEDVRIVFAVSRHHEFTILRHRDGRRLDVATISAAQAAQVSQAVGAVPALAYRMRQLMRWVVAEQARF